VSTTRLVVLLVGLLAPGLARAEPTGPAPVPVPTLEPEAHAPPDAQPPAESSVVTWQIAGGSAVAVAASVAVIGMATIGDGAGGFFVWPLAFGVPAASGLTVCAIGDYSVQYRTSCSRAVVAAYTGALVGALAGVAVPHYLTWGRLSSDTAYWVGGAIGFVVGQGLLATFGGRQKIQTAPPAVQPPVSEDPPSQRRSLRDQPGQRGWAAGAVMPGQVGVSLLSGTF
jgi:hypothetical protein